MFTHELKIFTGFNIKKKDRSSNLSLPLISSLTKSKIYEKKSTLQMSDFFIVKKYQSSLSLVKSYFINPYKKEKGQIENLSLPLISSLTKSKIYEKKSTSQMSDFL
jgi:hypothetical protein